MGCMTGSGSVLGACAEHSGRETWSRWLVATSSVDIGKSGGDVTGVGYVIWGGRYWGEVPQNA